MCYYIPMMTKTELTNIINNLPKATKNAPYAYIAHFEDVTGLTKAEIAELGRSRKVWLSRCDLSELFDGQLLAMSRIEMDGDRRHFIQAMP